MNLSITTHDSEHDAREVLNIALRIGRRVFGTTDREESRSIKPGRSNQRKMSALDNVLGLSNLYDEYGTILQHRYLPEQELVLCKCETAIVFLSLNGTITESIPVDQAETIVAIHECDTGCQILMSNQDRLCLIRNTPAGAKRIEFSEPGPNSNSAAWSPSGSHIAVGHNYDSSVSVWSTDSGELVWKHSTTWDMDGQCLQRPDLVVTGWSRDGRYIVTSSIYLIAWAIIIWHAESGEITALIN